MDKRLVCWKSKDDCRKYHNEIGYSFAIDDIVKRSMTYGNMVKFRDDEHIEEFQGLYDVRIY